MPLLQVILNLVRQLGALEETPREPEDPFNNPDIASMTQRQLADLPLPHHAGDPSDNLKSQPLRHCA